MSSRNKGQMEMAGLVVIVILITLGILFMAQFALKDEPSKKIFTRKELAASTMAALMKTTVVDCTGGPTQFPQIEGDLLDDCAVWGNEYSQYVCDGQPSCSFLHTKIEELLGETLGVWGKKYHFVSEKVSTGMSVFEEKIEGLNGNCEDRERDTSGDFYLPSGDGLVRSVLYVCE
ncbi:hypothetical protein COV17_01440 [Candidatus Woesearchaeota archaeon CG10_big_fil_rev_8_21_14_0_10_36_11]|nr:MAG: hypothetical protein COV17_01440 [Candidatus Woesearchaeota archaeon CG10_big_fil_rev_8_21_14_0_10_36_11]